MHGPGVFNSILPGPGLFNPILPDPGLFNPILPDPGLFNPILPGPGLIKVSKNDPHVVLDHGVELRRQLVIETLRHNDVEII